MSVDVHLFSGQDDFAAIKGALERFHASPSDSERRAAEAVLVEAQRLHECLLCCPAWLSSAVFSLQFYAMQTILYHVERRWDVIDGALQGEIIALLIERGRDLWGHVVVARKAIQALAIAMARSYPERNVWEQSNLLSGLADQQDAAFTFGMLAEVPLEVDRLGLSAASQYDFKHFLSAQAGAVISLLGRTSTDACGDDGGQRAVSPSMWLKVFASWTTIKAFREACIEAGIVGRAIGELGRGEAREEATAALIAFLESGVEALPMARLLPCFTSLARTIEGLIEEGEGEGLLALGKIFRLYGDLVVDDLFGSQAESEAFAFLALLLTFTRLEWRLASPPSADTALFWIGYCDELARRQPNASGRSAHHQVVAAVLEAISDALCRAAPMTPAMVTYRGELTEVIQAIYPVVPDVLFGKIQHWLAALGRSLGPAMASLEGCSDGVSCVRHGEFAVWLYSTFCEYVCDQEGRDVALLCEIRKIGVSMLAMQPSARGGEALRTSTGLLFKSIIAAIKASHRKVLADATLHGDCANFMMAYVSNFASGDVRDRGSSIYTDEVCALVLDALSRLQTSQMDPFMMASVSLVLQLPLQLQEGLWRLTCGAIGRSVPHLGDEDGKPKDSSITGQACAFCAGLLAKGRSKVSSGGIAVGYAMVKDLFDALAPLPTAWHADEQVCSLISAFAAEATFDDGDLQATCAAWRAILGAVAPSSSAAQLQPITEPIIEVALRTLSGEILAILEVLVASLPALSGRLLALLADAMASSIGDDERVCQGLYLLNRLAAATFKDSDASQMAPLVVALAARLHTRSITNEYVQGVVRLTTSIHGQLSRVEDREAIFRLLLEACRANLTDSQVEMCAHLVLRFLLADTLLLGRAIEDVLVVGAGGDGEKLGLAKKMVSCRMPRRFTQLFMSLLGRG